MTPEQALAGSGGPIRRRAAGRPAAIVRTGWMPGGTPALVLATVPGLGLAEWAGEHRAEADQLARTAGAVLFRGFAVDTPADFRAAAGGLTDTVLDYGERSSPRTEVQDGVYTSTDHPADQPIPLHNEQSYTLDWPLRLLFFCEVEPERQGRTPLADSRRILARLDPQLLDRFDRQGIRYVRNYLPGIGLSWQEAFQTTDRSDVERYARAADIELEWVSAEHLRTSQLRRAVHTHPVTGERTWFNHALFFHVSSLPGGLAGELRDALEEEDLPYNTYYGDGAPIEPDTVRRLRAAYEAETVAFDWRRGDVLMVENMLVAHGREPFGGARRILTAMADPVSAYATARDGEA